MANHRKACQWCGHTGDARDITNQGYHIECAKEASSFIMDQLHGGNSIVFREWYAKRYPGRLIPVRGRQRPGDQTGA